MVMYGSVEWARLTTLYTIKCEKAFYYNGNFLPEYSQLNEYNER